MVWHFLILSVVSLLSLDSTDSRRSQPFFTGQPWLSSSWSPQYVGGQWALSDKLLIFQATFPTHCSSDILFQFFETTLAKNSGKGTPTFLEETRMMKVVADLWRKAGIWTATMLSFPSPNVSATKAKQRDFYMIKKCHTIIITEEEHYIYSFFKHFQNRGTGQPL